MRHFVTKTEEHFLGGIVSENSSLCWVGNAAKRREIFTYLHYSFGAKMLISTIFQSVLGEALYLCGEKFTPRSGVNFLSVGSLGAFFHFLSYRFPLPAHQLLPVKWTAISKNIIAIAITIIKWNYSKWNSALKHQSRTIEIRLNSHQIKFEIISRKAILD